MAVVLLFAITTFLGAFLLFLVQPMVARMLLPALGGSPAVWNVCMVFFQAALLAGYAYAHALTRRLNARPQLILHALVLAMPLAVLPLTKPTDVPPAGGSPIAWLLATLTLTVGAPFLVLSTTGPLAQRWLAATDHPSASDPYFLYAASNAGSLGALLVYPLAVEPTMSLGSQARLWSGAYVAFAVLVGVCGLIRLRSGSRGSGRPAVAAGRASAGSRAQWLLLAFIPSTCLLGVTQFITSDIAAVPMLWVLPLATYLLTFVVAFSGRLKIPPEAPGALLAVLVVAIAATLQLGLRPAAWFLIPLHLLTLASVGLIGHGALATKRPPPERLTEFYLWVALGGVLGGVFNALLAPLIFDRVAEYPIALFLACFLIPSWVPRDGRRPGLGPLDLLLPVLVFAAAWGLGALARTELEDTQATVVAVVAAVVPAIACLAFVSRPARFALGAGGLLMLGLVQPAKEGETLLVARTFFGVHRVLRLPGTRFDVIDPRGRPGALQVPFHALIHGMTQHGMQLLRDDLRRVPTCYYHRTGPIGQVFESLGATRSVGLGRVGIVGLGAGTLAAYAIPGRHITYFEIDPEVVRIAKDTRFFTYLADAVEPVDVVLGDGRLSLARTPDGSFDLIVLDAFSSDAIPVHLLTRQALQTYLRKLRPDGVLAFHLSSQYLNLVPVVDAIARDLGLRGLVQDDDVETVQQQLEGKCESTWAILARESSDLGPLWTDVRWRHSLEGPENAPGRRYLWTDDYADVLGVLSPIW
jgi:SAM-dependent methyltransferase